MKTKRGRNQNGTWLHRRLAVVFTRWLDINFAIWCDSKIDEIIRDKVVFVDSRKDASIGYLVMSEILQVTRASLDKDTPPYHYANETKMLNYILVGVFAPLNRETLSPIDLKLLSHLEARNAVMIGRGMIGEYEGRKDILKQFAADWGVRHGIRNQPQISND